MTILKNTGLTEKCIRKAMKFLNLTECNTLQFSFHRRMASVSIILQYGLPDTDVCQYVFPEISVIKIIMYCQLTLIPKYI